MFGVEARFPWRPGLFTRQSAAEARTVLQNKKDRGESLGEVQQLVEVASNQEQAEAWRRVASKRRAHRIRRPEILSSSNHFTQSRQEKAQLACYAVSGEDGGYRFSSVEPLSGSARSGSPVHSSFEGRVFRPSSGLSGPKFSPPVLLTRALTSAPSGFEASMVRLHLTLSSFCADRSKSGLDYGRRR